jgi:hypothetical protein
LTVLLEQLIKSIKKYTPTARVKSSDEFIPSVTLDTRNKQIPNLVDAPGELFTIVGAANH